jgi:hypothetical protein
VKTPKFRAGMENKNKKVHPAHWHLESGEAHLQHRSSLAATKL